MSYDNQPELVSDSTAIKKAMEKYQNDPVFHSQLPIKLENGFVFTEIKLICPYCHKAASPDKSKGKANTAFGNIIMIDTLSECEYCQFLFPFIARIKPYKKQYILETIKDGKWVAFESETPAWLLWLNQLKNYLLGRKPQ